ncbi:MAG: ABC transporter ATP-binding protein [Rhizobiales bacterium 12-68-15]|nr:MAG: ABC transporter ATP-binding protein [Rhizobiales bacterium 12-68-15]
MRIEINHRCADAESYRAARVKSLFNVESGCTFDLSADIPIDETDWQIGVVVGPSGSGKSSIGRALCTSPADWWEPDDWPNDRPIIDAIAPAGSFDDVTGALAAVGLGSVPPWLRPYHVLSTGERFRADLARLVCEAPGFAVVDEFSSVVDRQIACIGAHAFSKAWRRTGGRAVLLSCHYDILDWVQPDWVFDTGAGAFSGRWLQRRPQIELEIRESGWDWWWRFEPHHYLKVPRMIAAGCYVGFVDDVPVAHVAFSTRPGLKEARACRLVVMPEWQGAGIGLRFLNAICAMWRRGQNRYSRPMPTLFHTSHPGLAAALRRHPYWAQVSAELCGGDKGRSRASMQQSGKGAGTGYGGHFRAVQGFRYVEGCAANVA